MEPESQVPKYGPEQSLVQPGQTYEHGPQLLTPEHAVEAGDRRIELSSEAAALAADSTVVSVTGPILPAPIAQATTSTDDANDPSTFPVAAADDDLIEREWVDKAKKIISETRDDPYGREKAVNQLQKDYLKKRYGKELGEA